jgi:hypothetical protein
MSVNDDLAETCAARDREADRAISNLAHLGTHSMIHIICAWIPLEELKAMNEFWEKDN